jgi:hypothetical protein
MEKGATKPKCVEQPWSIFKAKTANAVRQAWRGANLGLVPDFMALNGGPSDFPLVFFTDGARCIHDEIEKMFSFTKYKTVLDWYHLVKKFREYHGMVLIGKEIAGGYLAAIKPLP